MQLKYRETKTGNIVIEVMDHDLKEVEKMRYLFEKNGFATTLVPYSDCGNTWLVAATKE